MPITGGMIVGGGALLGGAISGIAQSNAAKDQQAAAERAQKLALGFAAPTDAELKTLNNQIQLYETQYTNASSSINRLQKQLTDLYGPAIMEQGTKLLESLKGKPSAMATAYNAQRAKSREQLVQQLTSQLGPGALTSSVGQQALNNFDFQTNNGYAQVNEQGINNEINRLGALNGEQSSVLQNTNAIFGNLRSALSGIQQTQDRFQTRQLQAAESTSPAVISNAGADNVLLNSVGNMITAGSKGFATGYGMYGNQPTTTGQQSPTPMQNTVFGSSFEDSGLANNLNGNQFNSQPSFGLKSEPLFGSIGEG